MSAAPKHRDKIVRAAALLFRRNGYAATGMNDIVALSGAPKGSVYHYFPEGKEQIAIETIHYASGLVAKTLAELSETYSTPSDMVSAYGTLLRGWLAKSEYQDGCPITTTLLELSATSEPVAQAGRSAFASWKNIYQGKLTAAGVSEQRANSLASMAVISFQGALIMTKVEHSSQPIVDVVAEITSLFDAAVS
ncbi:MAG: TetR family transcriptional regulator [Burkholderiales bacterium RIFCSPLOWO2_02_FULL_57_36]|nr:MAG: TetR family transcriptional regulator [Burkholderiales bacterium RIFCSPLOWO2_02_FULL_57_36]